MQKGLGPDLPDKAIANKKVTQLLFNESLEVCIASLTALTFACCVEEIRGVRQEVPHV